MGPHLLVFGDSLSFHGPDGPYAADDPRLWPNVTAAALGGRADLVAGLGWTARDAWWSLIGDPRVWADLHRVDAVVLAVGSMDTLPSPLPTYLRNGLRYLRPDGVRRAVRKAYLAAQPRLSIALRGRPLVLPTKLTVRYLDTAVGALRVLRPELPIVGVLPPVHRAASYGLVHTGREATSRALAEWGRGSGVPLLDLAAVVGDHVLSGRGNPDGMHWGWEGHN
ncbi:MAG: diglucosylglycerate octanoyltransferase, partial [Haloechinothrix sp.]